MGFTKVHNHMAQQSFMNCTAMNNAMCKLTCPVIQMHTERKLNHTHQECIKLSCSVLRMHVDFIFLSGKGNRWKSERPLQVQNQTLCEEQACESYITTLSTKA